MNINDLDNLQRLMWKVFCEHLSAPSSLVSVEQSLPPVHQLHLHSVQRQQCMQRGDYSCNCCLTIWLRYLFWGNKLDCLKVSFPHSLSRASKAVVQYKSVYTCTPVSYLPYTCNCQGETWEMNYHRKLYCTITHRIHSLPGQYSDHVLLLLTDSTAVQQLLSECWQR